MTIRVLLADDQALVRGALAALLSMERDIEVVAQVDSAAGLAEHAQRSRADVALVDIDMPGGGGFAATEHLREDYPACRVLIVTTFSRPGYLARALAAGARGYVVKDAPPEELAQAIRRVHSGLRAIDPALAAESWATIASPLTPQEEQVARRALRGLSPGDIAQDMGISAGTVRNYISAIIAKTGAGNRFEAVRVAEERGWILPG
ncbi:response regulator transcription factor [Corynebacterium uberis]|uniref:response regulator transcription factor n=1 Tax=Corynebacterium TaxID=1716 RepID=UPI001D0A33ED|nr:MULTISPECIES: response regulator transcription factor [Corynebacterium]MCZ9310136.1 response regulator transcription factor [Corynebacterium sp. c6VSa_13]UDL73277.1 response regulator transcription factor [Corynebacterium uberis]UDL75845.1 response regulator transcription factor [Corynebacterium uberis]UDL78058.1 response regulator transcription factor [Corynebacterium uberis]UDL80340.1 response regulator transcription factor [Corynebacterium uberis]